MKKPSDSSDPSDLAARIPEVLPEGYRKLLNPEPTTEDHKSIIDTVRHKSSEIMGNCREFVDAIQGSLSDLRKFLGKISQLPESVSKRTLLSLLTLAFPLLSGIGCVSMYHPDYRKNDQGKHKIYVDHHLKQIRERLLRNLFENPLLDEVFQLKAKGTFSHHAKVELLETLVKEGKIPHLPEISEEQKEKIFENLRYLIEEASQEQFLECLMLFKSVRDTLGILNVDRYSQEMLKEALKNYTDPEYNKEKPVVLCIMSRADHNTIGGIQALSVESHRVEELKKAYKVVLIETASIEEILHHIMTLEKKGILKEGRLKGVLIGTHSDQHALQAGIDIHNVGQLLPLTRFFQKKGSLVVLAGCSTGRGGEEEQNITNSFRLLFPEAVNTLGCSGYLTGISFALAENGELKEGSTTLSGIPDLLTLGLYDSTYDPKRSDVARHIVERMNRKTKEENMPKPDGKPPSVWDKLKIKENFGENDKIPDDFIEDSVYEGLSSPTLIKALHSRNISPSSFASFLKNYKGILCPSLADIICSIEGKYSMNQINAYFSLGIVSLRKVNSCINMGITPELLDKYRQSGVEDMELIISLHSEKVQPNKIRYGDIEMFKTIKYGESGLNNSDIAFCLSNGLTPESVSLYLKSGVRGGFRKELSILAINDLKKRGIDPELTENLVAAGIKNYFDICSCVDSLKDFDLSLRELKDSLRYKKLLALKFSFNDHYDLLGWILFVKKNPDYKKNICKYATDKMESTYENIKKYLIEMKITDDETIQKYENILNNKKSGKVSPMSIALLLDANITPEELQEYLSSRIDFSYSGSRIHDVITLKKKGVSPSLGQLFATHVSSFAPEIISLLNDLQMKGISLEDCVKYLRAVSKFYSGISLSSQIAGLKSNHVTPERALKFAKRGITTPEEMIAEQKKQHAKKQEGKKSSRPLSFLDKNEKRGK